MQKLSPATALSMLVKTLNSSPSTLSSPLLFIASLNNVHVMGGDMNAQIRKNGNQKYSQHNSSNRNGQHLTNFTIENTLTNLSTKKGEKTKERLIRKQYLCTDRQRLYNKKWKNSAVNCEAYSSFAGVSSDHRIVSAKLRLTLRKNATRTTTTIHYDLALLNNKDIRDKFEIELKKQIRCITGEDRNKTNIRISSTPIKAAAKFMPIKHRTKSRVPWETLTVREKRADVKTASKCNRKKPMNSNALKLKKKNTK